MSLGVAHHDEYGDEAKDGRRVIGCTRAGAAVLPHVKVYLRERSCMQKESAVGGNRTRDLWFIRPVLYLLSYNC